jgi:hypothetical protein
MWINVEQLKGKTDKILNASIVQQKTFMLL